MSASEMWGLLFPLGMFSDLGKGRQFLLRSENTGPEFRDLWKTLD